MFHSYRRKSKTTHAGSALVIALFVIIVMTLLGTALIRMLSSEAESIVYEVLGTRAFQAAQSGLQIKLQERFPLLPNPGTCNTTDTIDFSTIEGLKNCKAINVSCSNEPPINGVNYYRIKSTGQCEVAGILTSRTLEVQVRDL